MAGRAGRKPPGRRGGERRGRHHPEAEAAVRQEGQAAAIAGRGAGEDGGPGSADLAGGPREGRFRRLPAGAGEDRPAEARGGRRAGLSRVPLRRPAGRLRAGGVDRQRGPRTGRPARGVGSPGGRDPLKRPATGRLDPPAPLSGRRAGVVRARGGRADRVRLRRRAPGHDRASVLHRPGAARLPHHDPIQRAILQRGLLRHPSRVGPRDLRPGFARRAVRAATGGGRLTGHPRVAVPAVGEHGRTEPALLGALLPPGPTPFSRGAGRRQAGRLLFCGQRRAAFADPGGGRRGDLQPARPRPVRVGAGPAGGRSAGRRAAGGLEREVPPVPPDRSARRCQRRAPGHPLGRRADRLFSHLCPGEPVRGPVVRPGGGRPGRAGRAAGPGRVPATVPVAP